MAAVASSAVASSAVAVPSFSGLRAAKTSGAQKVVMASPSQRVSSGVVRASLKEVGAVVVATAASALIASNAMAVDVLLGADDGSLAFVPSDFSVSSGDKIVFKNNAGFPHNVVFDEDEIPGGVDASKISMPEEELLNGAGETYSVTLTEKGTYSFYCAPHQGAVFIPYTRSYARVELLQNLGGPPPLTRVNGNSKVIGLPGLQVRFGVKASLKEVGAVVAVASAVIVAMPWLSMCCWVVMMDLWLSFPTISQSAPARRLSSRITPVPHSTLCSTRTRFPEE